MAEDVNKIIEDDVTTALKEEQVLQGELITLETKLREANPQFQAFIEKQAELKAVQAKNSDLWKQVEAQMIDNNIKSIKGDWGSITIAERIGFDYDKTELPKKFYKVVVDAKKVADTYKLEGKVKGATPKWTKYLTKRLK